MWDKMVKKAVNVEAKASLQLHSGTREIDSKCPRSYKPSVKKDKDNTNQEHWDRDKNKNKAKSYNLSSANSQPSTQAFKKDKRDGNRQGSHPTTGINATKVA